MKARLYTRLSMVLILALFLPTGIRFPARAQSQPAGSTYDGLPVVEFEEDFSGDLSQWTLFGSPLPYIDAAMGNPAPSLQINGDHNYASGVQSTKGITPTVGMVISFQLQTSTMSALAHSVSLALA